MTEMTRFIIQTSGGLIIILYLFWKCWCYK